MSYKKLPGGIGQHANCWPDPRRRTLQSRTKDSVTAAGDGRKGDLLSEASDRIAGVLGGGEPEKCSEGEGERQNRRHGERLKQREKERRKRGVDLH